MRLILLALILSGVLCVSAHEEVQPVISQPAALAGPWEVPGPSTVDGIFFMIIPLRYESIYSCERISQRSGNSGRPIVSCR
jgi:hypothetical protein